MMKTKFQLEDFKTTSEWYESRVFIQSAYRDLSEHKSVLSEKHAPSQTPRQMKGMAPGTLVALWLHSLPTYTPECTTCVILSIYLTFLWADFLIHERQSRISLSTSQQGHLDFHEVYTILNFSVIASIFSIWEQEKIHHQKLVMGSPPVGLSLDLVLKKQFLQLCSRMPQLERTYPWDQKGKHAGFEWAWSWQLMGSSKRKKTQVQEAAMSSKWIRPGSRQPVLSTRQQPCKVLVRILALPS